MFFPVIIYDVAYPRPLKYARKNLLLDLIYLHCIHKLIIVENEIFNNNLQNYQCGR